MITAAQKKVTAPSAEERATALWDELTESERATLIRTWDRLADEEIGRLSEASRPSSIPAGVIRLMWEGRGSRMNKPPCPA
jgi:hypothetical protein